MVADEKSSFLHSIAAKYHIADNDAHAAHAAPGIWPLVPVPNFIIVLVLVSIASATAGCLYHWSLPVTKRLQLLVVRTSNLVCAAAWGVLCWEQLSRFPEAVLALAACALAAALHVVVICAKRGQCSFPELPAYTKFQVPVEKTVGQDQEQGQVMHNPLLVISRKSTPRGGLRVASAANSTTDGDTCSVSECLMFDVDNMPGMVVVPKSDPSSEKVAKFYQSKLLCVADDKSKDM